jgi:hypothetical protein
MIVGVYATLGVFLLLASRNPEQHRSLIWFTVWSSVVHAAIMAVQSIVDTGERGHLIADVPALLSQGHPGDFQIPKLLCRGPAQGRRHKKSVP